MPVYSETLIKVRYSETDQMGVVYHGNYVQYLELARIDWLSKLGVSYKTMEERGVMLPVYSLDLKFKKSAYFDDQLIVKTCLKKIPTASIFFEHEIWNTKQELLTLANIKLVFVNSKNRKPIPCPIYLSEILNEKLRG